MHRVSFAFGASDFRGTRRNSLAKAAMIYHLDTDDAAIIYHVSFAVGRSGGRTERRGVIANGALSTDSA
jgi:hypothetical protein